MMQRWFQRLHMDGWRLSTSIVAWSLVLLMVVQVAVLLIVHAFVDINARKQVAKDLVGAERVWSDLVRQKVERLTLNAGVLASDSGFKEAVNSLDEATIRSALENYGERTGAAVAAQLNNELGTTAIGIDASKNIDIRPALLEQVAVQLRSGLAGRASPGRRRAGPPGPPANWPWCRAIPTCL